MRRTIFFLTAFLLMAFQSGKKSFIPPGTVKLNDNLFMDATEISNFSWLEYEMDVRKKYGHESPEHISVMPDTSVWEDAGKFMQPYIKHYYQHPAYRNYPVVGISYEQAVDYCKWRSKKVNQLLFIRSHKGITVENIDQIDSIPQIVEYRLPTEHEWKLAAGLGYSERAQKSIEKKCKGCPKGNFLRKDKSQVSVNSSNDLTAPVSSYWPNEKGIYNLMGNVSEMVDEKGIAKGGSWMDEEGSVDILSLQKYTKAGPWLGFRCVATMKYEQKN